MKKFFKIIIALIIIIFLLILININNTWWFNIIGSITGVTSNVGKWIIASVLDLIVTIVIIIITFIFFKGEDD